MIIFSLAFLYVCAYDLDKTNKISGSRERLNQSPWLYICLPIYVFAHTVCSRFAFLVRGVYPDLYRK